MVNALLGVIQESRAQAALEALKNLSAPAAKVWRDGVLTSMKATDLVPGDVVEFEAGGSSSPPTAACCPPPACRSTSRR